MLHMMSAAWRFSAVAFGPRSPKARESSGTTTAKVGESTDWTKVVAANAWTVASTSLGFEALLTSLGITGSTSRLPDRPKAAVTCVARRRETWGRSDDHDDGVAASRRWRGARRHRCTRCLSPTRHDITEAVRNGSNLDQRARLMDTSLVDGVDA